MARKLCKGTTDRGSPCRADARSGSDYCFWHDPHSRAARNAAARRGGVVRARGPWPTTRASWPPASPTP